MITRYDNAASLYPPGEKGVGMFASINSGDLTGIVKIPFEKGEKIRVNLP